MSTEILIGIAVFAFVVLVVFIILSLIKFSKAIDKIEVKLNKITTEFTITQLELNRTLISSHHLTERINEKIEDLNSLFFSIRKVGDLFKNTVDQIELNQYELEKDHEREIRTNIVAYAEIANLFIKVFKQFKKWK